MKIMEIRNLQYSYGNLKVLKGVDMDFYKGVFYGILGPNGCGKSTLLKNLYGYLKPSAGTIDLAGVNIRHMNPRERARNIAYVPQDSHVGFDFTVFDIIAMGRNPYHSALDNLNSSDIEQIEKAMKETSTSHLRNKSINELSGGEKQRTLIARAFAQDSDIILMDEPVSMLDINHQVEIMDLARSLADSMGKTIVCVMHDLNLAAQYTQHIFLMKDGVVVRAGIPDEILDAGIIKDVYGANVFVGSNEVTGSRIVIPLSRLNNSF